MKVTIVVENVADVELLQRNIGTNVFLSWGMKTVRGEIKGVKNGDAIRDVQELMDDSGSTSHDGILA
jgi:hypothetical protein